MQKDMDTIQFESRSELEYLTSALNTFLKEHPKAEEKDAVSELSNLLDSMWYEW